MGSYTITRWGSTIRWTNEHGWERSLPCNAVTAEGPCARERGHDGPHRYRDPDGLGPAPVITPLDHRGEA